MRVICADALVGMDVTSGSSPVQRDGEELAAVVPASGGAPPCRRWLGASATTAFVLSLLVVAAVGGIRSVRSGPTDTLADIVSFVGGVDTVHIESAVTVNAANDVGLGSSTTTKWRSRADVRLPADAHVLIETGDRVYETVLLGDTVYGRSAVAEVNLYRSAWATGTREFAPTIEGAALGHEPGDSPAGADAWDLLNQGVGFGDDLERLRRVFARMDDPSRASEHVIRVEVSLDEFLIAYYGDSGLDDRAWVETEKFDGVVTFDLTSGPGGRLDRVVMQLDGGARPDGARPRPHWRSTSDVRFTKWGKPVGIAVPDLDVEFSAGFVDNANILNAPLTVLAPKTVPDDLRLLEGSLFAPAERGLVEGDCGKVTLYYANPDEERWSQEGGYSNLRFLNLDITNMECDSDDSRTDDAYLEKRAAAPQPYLVGSYRGTIARYDTTDAGAGAYIVLTVGDVEVFVDSTLTDDETALALRELVPFNPATQPIWPVAAD